jgi:hypothetical protein
MARSGPGAEVGGKAMAGGGGWRFGGTSDAPP